MNLYGVLLVSAVMGRHGVILSECTWGHRPFDPPAVQRDCAELRLMLFCSPALGLCDNDNFNATKVANSWI